MAKKSGWASWSQKKLKKAAKKVHAGYAAIIVICLVIGLVAGVALAMMSTKGDTFVLNGEKYNTVTVGDTLSYTDEGITCVSMGKDVSGCVEINTNMKRSEDGKTFMADTSREYEYYIEYKITEGRYAGLSKVRIFTVSPASVDGNTDGQ